MPYINTTTTKTISKEQQTALTQEFGKAIELIPGKSEEWLMLSFRDEARMAFRGDSMRDCAMLEVEIFGSATDASLGRLTKALCETVNRVLGIDTDRVYVKYEKIDTWGYDGSNF